MEKSFSTPVCSGAGEIVASLYVPAFQCFANSNDRLAKGRSDRRKTPDRRKNAATRVLLLGRVRELALYRAEVLSGHGYRVLTPSNKEEAVRAIRGGNYDVAILTYTLSSETVEEFAQLIREYCARCPVIVITDTNRFDRRINPDETVIADDGPAALVAALRRVTRKQ